MAVLIRSVLLITNPASRRGRRLARRAQGTFGERGIACDLVFTERAGHAAELARDHAGSYDAVFTLGGDGTAMEAAGALADTGIPLGVLPGGTGNLLARAIGIPLDVRRAIPQLLEGDVRRVDLGRHQQSGHRFAVAAGAGIDASMVAETPSWLKRHLGVLAYTLIATRAALRAVLFHDYFRVRLTVDGVVEEERAAAAVIVANFGAILHDRITFGPGIQEDDGTLDACIFSPHSLMDALRIMWRVTRKKFEEDDCLVYRRGTNIRVETDPPRLFQADGELLGYTPADISVQPLAAHLLVPKAS